MRSYISQLDSRRELEADIMRFGGACIHVQGRAFFFYALSLRLGMRHMTRVIPKSLKSMKHKKLNERRHFILYVFDSRD